jgi:hypothetical protein
VCQWQDELLYATSYPAKTLTGLVEVPQSSRASANLQLTNIFRGDQVGVISKPGFPGSCQKWIWWWNDHGQWTGTLRIKLL